MHTLKKIIVSITCFGLVAMALPTNTVNATTAAELQAKIDALMAEINTLKAQLAEIEGTPAAATACAISSFDRNLAQGARGDDVKCLQIVLNSDSETQITGSGAGSPGKETKYFGPLTKAAVVKFQTKNAISPATGYVGPKTRAKLNEILGTTVSTSTTSTTSTTPVVTGKGLTVALADDVTAPVSIVADNTADDGAQSMIPMLGLKLSNGDSSDVKVTQISFKRSETLSDGRISQAYLYEGNNLLAEYSSFSNSILTFSNSNGLLTIPANSSKTVTLKIDLGNGAESGLLVRFSVQSTSSIVSNASAVNGTFPLVSGYSSTGRVNDLGKLTIVNSTNPAANVDPQTGFEVFNFKLIGSDQKIEVRKLKFTNIGSTAASDLTNLALYDGGTPVGSVIANMDSDKTVTFDLTSNPIVIDKGITKNMHLRADIVGGTNRTFRFGIQNMTDVTVYDTQYGAYLKPNKADSWTVVQADNASTINTGKLTLARAADSPNTNVAKDATNVVIAKFDVKAEGEDVKITAMDLRVYGTVGADGLYQGKIYFDGAQKGSTVNLDSAAIEGTAPANTFSFGNTFIVPSGTTKTLEIKSDIKKETGASYNGSENFTVKINSVTAQGKTSLQAVNPGPATAYQLTIASGALTSAKNQSVSNWSATNPTGVQGAVKALVGSFTVTAGSAEGANITSVKIGDSGSAFNNLENLQVFYGSTQIGSTQSSLTANSNYTFSPSPYISLSASQQIVLDVYANIKTSAATGFQGTIDLDEVNGIGKVTNTGVNDTTSRTGQAIYIASGGSLTVALDSGTPKAGQVMANDSAVEFTKVKFTAGVGEAINVNQIVVSSTLGGSAPTSSIKNIKLYDGSTQIGSTVAGLSGDGTATFDISATPWVIASGATKYLSIKADINDYLNIQSGGSVVLQLNAGAVTSKGAVSGNSGGTSATTTGNAMYTYKTKVVAALNSNSPSGTNLVKNVAQDVLHFNIKNESSSYEADFNAATFTIAYSPGSTGNATASVDRIFNLYDKADLTTSIGSGTITASTTINGASLVIDVSPDFTISAGATKTFVLKGDTRDVDDSSSSPGSFQFYINAGTDLNWDDKVSTSIATAQTKTFPLYGNTLSY